MKLSKLRLSHFTSLNALHSEEFLVSLSQGFIELVAELPLDLIVGAWILFLDHKSIEYLIDIGLAEHQSLQVKMIRRYLLSC